MYIISHQFFFAGSFNSTATSFIIYETNVYNIEEGELCIHSVVVSHTCTYMYIQRCSLWYINCTHAVLLCIIIYF